MVQVYKNSVDRKVELFDGEFLLKLNFQPDVELSQEQTSKVTGALFAPGKHHALKDQLSDEVQGQGNTEREALLDLIEKLLAAVKEEKLSKALENLKIKVTGEGLGFCTPRYVPPSERS